jgi:H+/Cl- antiporter ClcA
LKLKPLFRLNQLRLTARLRELRLQFFLKARHFARDFNRIQGLALWAAAFAVGFAAVIYAQVFKHLEEFTGSLISTHPYLIYILSPVLFLLAWLMVHYWAPDASGSGIPQIIAANEMNYNDGKQKLIINRLLSMRTAGVKILSSLACVLGGGAIGREGPTLQISASIFHFFGRILRRYYPQVEEQTLIIAGAAAGLASAFNTPLGGIVYAIEELGGHHFHRVRTALLSAVIISGLVAQWMMGSYLYLGLPKVEGVGAEFLPTALVVGALCGLGGAVFGKTLYLLIRRRWAIHSFAKQALLTILCGLVMASLIKLNPNSAGTGLPLINDFLFHGSVADWSTPLYRYLATTVSYLSGAAGGIFSPSLAIGASMGSFFGSLIHSENQNLMVLLGMIAFLTGVTRTPFTSFILVVEMTDRHSAVLPMMAAALAAQSCASFINHKSFYEEVKERYLLRP